MMIYIAIQLFHSQIGSMHVLNLGNDSLSWLNVYSLELNILYFHKTDLDKMLCAFHCWVNKQTIFWSGPNFKERVTIFLNYREIIKNNHAYWKSQL